MTSASMSVKAPTAYTTIQLHIVATGQDQLYDINSELRATGFVHMVL
jgi:putative lipoic acid-binding regulatory protein